ncbi:MAG: EAL domain-containing protein [Campylobacterales bacterium]|nr:EAL domain-containing protein [Campylobacterales bacterium]
MATFQKLGVKMLSKWFKVLLVVLALISVTFWVLNYKQKSQRVQDTGYELYAMIEELKVKHHELNDAILKSALYRIYNNDIITQDIKNIDDQTELLQKSEIYTTAEYPKTKEFLNTLIFDQKEYNDNIELFKRENGKIKNSFSFITSSLEHLSNLKKKDSQKLLNIISHLTTIKSSMEIDANDDVEINIDFLNEIETVGENDKMYVNLYKTHINLLKKSLPSYMHLINKIIKDDAVENDFTILINAIKSENLTVLSKLDFEYYAILVFSLLTLLIIVYYIFLSESERQRIIKLQESYKESVTTDFLTGLKNRNAYLEAIEKNKSSVIILFDITDFSSINNLYGIEIGDFVLKNLGEKLKSNIECIKDTDIFKVGADQFAIIMVGYTLEEAYIIAANIVEVAERSNYKYDGLEQEISIQLQAGISAAKPFLINAMLALKSISKDYSEKVAIFDDSLNNKQEIQKNIDMIKKIKYAINNDNITMLFQPLVNLKTKEVAKHEALVRIKDEDEDKYISPFFFLELSKKAKLYSQITHEVIVKSIQAVIENNVPISLNLSIDDIMHKGTHNFILTTLQNNPDIAKKLTFELLESEEIKDFPALKEFIQKVKSFGVLIAIDDFGSGYSNYNYLLELDVDILKIDGSLIKNIDKSENNQLVVKSIVEFAKLADIKTVAEFVSSAEIEKVITELGIDYGQGYYYSEPKLLT